MTNFLAVDYLHKHHLTDLGETSTYHERRPVHPLRPCAFELRKKTDIRKMKNMRKKVAVVSQKGKKKRWKKGHSSDSNPEARKHRLAAKNRFFSRGEGRLRVQ